MVSSTQSNLPGFYNRLQVGGSATGSRWVDVRFLATRGLQSAELNELQTLINRRFESLGRAIFKEGGVLDGAIPSIIGGANEPNFKLTTGLVYFAGGINEVVEETMQIPMAGKVSIGIQYREYEITDVDDPTLLDPAEGARNYAEPGAARRMADWTWGWFQSDAVNDGKAALLNDDNSKMWTFFPIFEVQDGQIIVKEKPPVADATVELVAKYDREANGNYVVRGLLAEFTSESATHYTYNLQEGLANVLGYKIELVSGRRLIYPKDFNVQNVAGESHLLTAEPDGKATVWLNREPLSEITRLKGTKQKTVNVTRSLTENSDELPDASVIAIVEVKQGATVYAQGADWIPNGDNVNWSPGGAEPAGGSSYTVKYWYRTDVLPVATFKDHLIFDTLLANPVDGLVAGQLVDLDYTYKLPRKDLLVLNRDGSLERLIGTPQRRNPVAPKAADKQIALAEIELNWTEAPLVRNISIRAMPMSDLQDMATRLDSAYDLIAQERLRIDTLISDPTSKKGVFVDPFLDDDLRDQGRDQTGAIGEGELTLPLTAEAAFPSNVENRSTWHTLPFVLESLINQPQATAFMKINPYMAFDPVPARVRLTPATDFWITHVSKWLSPINLFFRRTRRGGNRLTVSSVTNLVNLARRTDTTIRQRTVGFTVDGFGPGETLVELTFDGINITPA